MALKTTKKSTHKTKFKQKCGFSSKNQTFQFLVEVRLRAQNVI
jgi:hypothetical protein